MTITQKSIEVLKNCFLVSPGEQRGRQVLRFQHGEMTKCEGNPEDSKNSESLPAIYLRATQEADFLNLLRETEIELKKNRIFGASRRLAESVLVLNIAYRQTDSRIPLEQMLGEYQEVEATMYVGIPTMAVIMSGEIESFLRGFVVGRFTIGGHANFEHHRRFEQAATEPRKAGTPDTPKAGAWIMREPIVCRILSAAFDESLAFAVRNYHLMNVTTLLAETVRSDFAVDQSIPAALGAPAFDADALMSLDKLRIDVAFGSCESVSLSLCDDYSRLIPANIAECGVKSRVLSHLMGELPLGSCPDVDRMLLAFSKFLLKAKAHEAGSRASDAFVHCVFALDLALGGKQDNTKNTTRRAAAIYAAASGVPFKVAEKELRAIFDARSKYVHEGIEIADKSFSLLLEICSLIAESLLKARGATEARSEGFVNAHWYPRLDLIVAAMIAGATISGEHFRECGLKAPPTPVPKLVH